MGLCEECINLAETGEECDRCGGNYKEENESHICDNCFQFTQGAILGVIGTMLATVIAVVIIVSLVP